MAAAGSTPRGIVIDNTNCKKSQRAGYLALAQELKYNPIAIVLDTEKEHCLFLDKCRGSNSHRTHLSKKVGQVPIHTFFKNFEPPTPAEGFTDVHHVHLILKYKNPSDEEFYHLKI